MANHRDATNAGAEENQATANPQEGAIEATTTDTTGDVAHTNASRRSTTTSRSVRS